MNAATPAEVASAVERLAADAQHRGAREPVVRGLTTVALVVILVLMLLDKV